MDEFVQVFGQMTIANVIIYIFAFSYVIEKGKKGYDWITKSHDKQQERENKEAMIEDQDKKITNLTKGMLALLSNDLYDRCEKALTENEITISELDKIKRLYEPYHSLGGNGTGTKLFEDVLRLRIKH